MQISYSILKSNCYLFETQTDVIKAKEEYFESKLES